MFDKSFRGIVPLDNVSVVFGGAFGFRFGSTTFNTILKTFKVLYRDI
jgi:hypothetical protein